MLGETSRSADVRGKEHRNALVQGEESSVMWKHTCDRHRDSVADFVMNVTGTFHNNAMLRQITEAAMINNVQKSVLINSKGE